jgi:hypothetical protein
VLCTASLYEAWFKGEAEAFLFLWRRAGVHILSDSISQSVLDGFSPSKALAYSEAVQSTIKKVPQIPKQINVNSTKVFKYICIVSCNSDKLGLQNQIKVQKLLSNLIGSVKSINTTKAGNLIVECIDNQQYKTLLKSTHLVL